MNTHHSNCAAGLLAVLLTLAGATNEALAQSGGPYTIANTTIADTGTTCAGGGFAVSGSAGQPDAYTVKGGAYSLAGGLWPAISNPRPTLRFIANGEFLVLSWPGSATGFVLQQATSLGAVAWADVNQTPTVVDGHKQVTLPVAAGNRYFRLKKP